MKISPHYERPIRVLRRGKKPHRLALPPEVRRARDIERFRDAIIEHKYKYLSVIDPQYRDMLLRLIYGMEKAGKAKIGTRFHVALFTLWFTTGSSKKVEDLIWRVWNGEVIQVGAAQGSDTGSELFVYDPSPPEREPATHVKPLLLSALLRDAPKDKPWIPEWVRERAALLKKAFETIGTEATCKLQQELSCSEWSES